MVFGLINNKSKQMKTYPRYLTPDAKPFNSVELAKWTEKIVTRWVNNVQLKKYTAIYCAGVYGGIATAYTVGCCLRCVFCWVNWSRDFPERYGKYLSPEEVYTQLESAGKKRGIRKARVSGGEPTIGKVHLLELLRLIEESNYFDLFILETNGILFGVDEDYVKALQKFTKVHVRISLKAGTPDAFTKKTGAIPESFEIPFNAIKNLIKYKISFHVAAMSADPRFMTLEERLALAKKLAEIDPLLIKHLEEEIVDPYKNTLKRLKYAGWDVEWPLRKIYKPLSNLLKNE